MGTTQHQWRCPRCRAAGHHHGRGPCLEHLPESQDCDGFLCHCESVGCDGPEVKEENHGQSEENPCYNARCGHCGWSGIFPTNGLDVAIAEATTPAPATFDPSQLTGWAKAAYEAGWTPPYGWQPELVVEEAPLKCNLHPTYKAKRAPRITTCDCIKIWEAKQKGKVT